MNFRRILRLLLLAAALAATTTPQSMRACAACFGQSDSPLAKGMNWGIFSLLLVVVSVLGGIAAFFIYLARRSAAGSLVVSGASVPASQAEHGSTFSAQPDPHPTQ